MARMHIADRSSLANDDETAEKNLYKITDAMSIIRLNKKKKRGRQRFIFTCLFCLIHSISSFSYYTIKRIFGLEKVQ